MATNVETDEKDENHLNREENEIDLKERKV